MEAEQRQHIGDRHAVRHQDHAFAIGLEVTTTAGIEHRVRYGSHGKRERAGGIDVLLDFAHFRPEHTLDLLDHGGLLNRVGQVPGKAIQQVQRRPFAVDRQALAVGKDQGVLNHLAVHPKVHVDHLRRELPEGVLQDVLAGSAAGPASEQHGFDPAGRSLDVLVQPPPLFRIDLQPLHHHAGLGELFPERVTNSGRGFDHPGADALDRQLEVAHRLAQCALLAVHRFDLRFE